MDIPPPQPTTVNPDSEPPQTQSNTLTKQLIPPPLTNGLLKRHKPLHHHHHHPPPYKECMKNHAAAMGGHALDGCGEFMPSPTSSPTYPTSLKCAACGCHRNFHRREPEESLVPSPSIQHVIEYQPHQRPAPGKSASPPPISSSYYPSSGPNMLLALSSGKKRFRTKFSQEQKEKMLELAEQVGWKMHKRDEDTINAFCNQIGVDKNVFKVWMHNNNNNNKSKKDLNINGNHNMTHDTSFSTGNVIFPKQAVQSATFDESNHNNHV